MARPGVYQDEVAQRQQAQQAEQWQQAMTIARLHSDVFGTEQGQKLLEYWVRIYIARPIVRAKDDAFAAGIREGQADVVRQLLINLETARFGPGGEPNGN
jgi:hypothetical protein